MNAEAKTFDNGHYKFEFPNGCKIEQKENRFTSVDAALDCKGNAGFQFETTEIITDRLSGETDDGMIDTMLSVFEQQWDGVSEVERGTDKYMINNQTAPYLIATYDQEFSNAFGMTKTENWVTMVMIIKSGDNMIVGQYTNDQDHFDKDLPMAEKIFKSVEVLGNNGTATGRDTDTKTYNFDDDPEFTKLCTEKPTPEQKTACDLVQKLEQFK